MEIERNLDGVGCRISEVWSGKKSVENESTYFQINGEEKLRRIKRERERRWGGFESVDNGRV